MPLKSLVRRLPSPVKNAVKQRLYPDLLAQGEVMPKWSLQSYDGHWKTAEKKRWSLLCFYPGDDTPGCTAQLQDLQDHRQLFEAQTVDIYGINPADAHSHAAFAEKYGFEFPILSDTNGTVAHLFGSLLKTPIKQMVIRTVYLVGPSGTIQFAERGSPPSQDLLKTIESCRTV